MKNPRWRKILKVIKPDAVKKMNTYFHHEHALATCGVSVLNPTRETDILETLCEYAETIGRTAKTEPHWIGKEWVSELMNFQS